jgi:hypothetical protein
VCDILARSVYTFSVQLTPRLLALQLVGYIPTVKLLLIFFFVWAWFIYVWHFFSPS